MADKVRVSDLDFVYISYHEPNKEENWADLLSKVPWAKRVDGVKGFDSAHKAAAEKAETDFFISVDGDNIIDDSFLLQTLDWSKTNPKAVHRWRAKNNVNDLVYFYDYNILNDDIEKLFESYSIDGVFHFAAYAAEGLSPFVRQFNYMNNFF